MIKTFTNKGLAELFEVGSTKLIDKQLHVRIISRLDTLNQARVVGDLAIPGWKFHALSGFTPTRYSIHVNGPRCITFEFSEEDAYRVDFEQYH